MNPLDEAVHQAIIMLELKRGNRKGALRQLGRLREELRAIGYEPAPETLALFAEKATFSGASRSPARFPVLPEPRTPFVGREAELAAMTTLANERGPRFVSIVGLGGVGKTRLALQFARRHGAEFEDGALFLPLAHLQDPAVLSPALAHHLNLTTEGETTREQVLQHLQHRSHLIVLDGLENLRGSETSGFLEEIVSRSERSLLLITSRLPVESSAERKVLVGGLRTPLAGSDAPEATEAVRLFSQASRRAPAAADMPAIASICRLLHGLPLALELAAGLTDHLTFEELVAELGAGNFDLLSSEDSAWPERHRTLRSLLHGTWQLLEPSARFSLERLSVFRASFGRLEAREVAGVGLSELRQLVDRSYVASEDTGRYRMHGMLRWFAKEQLLARKNGREVHRDLHLKAAERLLRTHSDGATTRLSDLEEKIRAFHHLFSAEAYERAGELLASFDTRMLLRWGQATTVLELHRRVGPFLTDPGLRSRNLNSIGLSLSRMGRYSEAVEAYEQALALARATGDRENEANYMGNLGIVYNISGNLKQSIESHLAAVAISDELGNLKAKGIDLGCLGLAYNRLGEPRTALRYHRKALETSREAGDLQSEANHLGNLAHLLLKLDDPTDALGHAHEALALRRRLGDKRGEAIDLLCLASVYAALDDSRQAERYFQAALTLNRAVGDRLGTCETLFRYGRYFGDRKQHDLELDLIREALGTSRAIGDRHMECEILAYLAEHHAKQGDVATATALRLTALSQLAEPDSVLGHAIEEALLDVVSREGETGLKRLLEIGSQLLKVATGAEYELPHVESVRHWRQLMRRQSPAAEASG